MDLYKSIFSTSSQVVTHLSHSVPRSRIRKCATALSTQLGVIEGAFELVISFPAGLTEFSLIAFIFCARKDGTIGLFERREVPKSGRENGDSVGGVVGLGGCNGEVESAGKTGGGG